MIEVSDSSLRYDREIKMPLFARHGVPEAWIFDLQYDQLLMFGDLREGVYRHHDAVARPGRRKLTALPDLEVDLTTLLL